MRFSVCWEQACPCISELPIAPCRSSCVCLLSARLVRGRSGSQQKVQQGQEAQEKGARPDALAPPGLMPRKTLPTPHNRARAAASDK